MNENPIEEVIFLHGLSGSGMADVFHRAADVVKLNWRNASSGSQNTEPPFYVAYP
jgi:hypothetical protein